MLVFTKFNSRMDKSENMRLILLLKTFTSDVNKFLLLNDILYHRSADKAMNPEDSFEGDPAKLKYKNTTVVWELLVEWSDKTQPQSWIPLKDLK